MAANYRDIRRINRHLGGIAVILRHLARLIGDDNRAISVLDVATGSGDIPVEILRWGRRRGKRIDVTGIDANPKAIQLANALSGSDLGMRFQEGNAFDLPFPNNYFDYVISSLTFHHFDDDGAVSALREMARVARKGVIVNDLRRAYLPAALIWLVTRLTGMHRMTRHDAPLSVLRSRTVAEYRSLATRVGFSAAAVHRHPFWRAAIVVKLEEGP